MTQYQPMKHKLLLTLLLLLAITTCWTIKASAQSQTAYQVADINPGAPAGSPGRMIVYDDTLYFAASGAGSGIELWRCDGTNTTMLADMNPTGNFDPQNFAIHNNILYFAADDGQGNNGLWSYSVNTNIAFEVAEGASWMVSYNGYLYTVGYSLPTNIELFRYDGSNYTLASDINPGVQTSYVSHLAVYDGKLFFGADGANGALTELWSFDGTTLAMASDVNVGGSAAPENLVSLQTANGEILCFVANSPMIPNTADNLGRELYKYDPINGSSLAADICPGTCIGMGQGKQAMITYENKLYFGGNNGTVNALFSYDGATATLIDPNLSDFNAICVANGLLYYQANDGVHGAELWSYDGINTTFVADVNPGAGSSYPTELVAFDNTLYFRANDGVTGNELWRLDHTVSISETEKQAAKIFTSNGIITVDATALTEQSMIDVFSMEGKHLHHQTIEAGKITRIDNSNIAESIVAVSVYNNTYSQTQKLIINK